MKKVEAFPEYTNNEELGPVVVTQIPMSGWFNLYALTDVHIGNNRHNRKLFRKVIETIKNDPKGYCFFNGDNVEMITPSDKMNPSGQIITPEEQLRFFVKIFKYLGKEKVLFFRSGNHDERMYRHVGVDGLRLVTEDLGIPYLGIGPQEIQIVFEKGEHKRLRIVTTHGEGCGAVKALQVMQNTFPSADLYFTGHTHEMFVDNKLCKVITDNGIEEYVPILKVAGGSFCGWCDYQRNANQQKKTEGCYVFRCSPKTGISVQGNLT